MRIVVFGLGYVGLANAVLLAESHEVVAVDIDEERVSKINRGESPIVDSDITRALARNNLNLRATTSAADALVSADFAIIATPTDYDPENDFFNTSSVEAVLGTISALSLDTVVVIKSTVPIGFTERMSDLHNGLTIVFSPEFLREGKALYDNQYPSRIISACRNAKVANEFALVLKQASLDPEVEVLVTNSTEAEAIKLFSNTYLAMRVAFFNELDTFARSNGLETRQIIDGVSLDPRIGGHYNNPSFGYGGYCLPKDTRQLLANYKNVPQTLMSAIVESNLLRKEFIANEVLKLSPSVVGVFRLTMKTGSDNFRSSSIQDVMSIIQGHGIDLLIFEPSWPDSSFDGVEVVEVFEEFVERSDVIISNRLDSALEPHIGKVITADVYSRD